MKKTKHIELTGVVSCTICEKYTKPVCGNVAACENPDRVFFCCPRGSTLQDGILDSLERPPATPRILAAVDAPGGELIWHYKRI